MQQLDLEERSYRLDNSYENTDWKLKIKSVKRLQLLLCIGRQYTGEKLNKNNKTYLVIILKH